MRHTSYGLQMRDGLWRASCACGWSGEPSPDLGAGTHELDGHLRDVVTREQRPSPVVRALASPSPGRGRTVGSVALGLAVVGAVLARDHARAA